MSVDEKLCAAVKPLLTEGEEGQVAFVAQRTPPWLPVLFLWSPFVARTRIAAAADRRLVVGVCERRLVQVVVAEMERDFPRRTRIGPPPHGRWHRREPLGLYIGRPYLDAIRTADELAGFDG